MAVVSQRTRRLLANRQFLYLWANQTFTQIAFYLVTFTLIVWVFELTKANVAVSLWLLATFIPSAALSIFAGVVVDNCDRKKIMITTNLLWALSVLAYILAKNNFVAVLLITMVAQGIDEFFGPAQLATLPRLVPKDELLGANSLFSLSMYATSVIGFVLAGPLLRFFGFEAPFVLAALLVSCGAFFVSRLPSMGRAEASPLRFSGKRIILHLWREARDGVTFCLRRPLITAVVLFVALLMVGGTAAGTLAPGFMEQGLGIDARDVSFVGGVPVSLGLLLGSILLRKFTQKEGWRSKRLVGMGLFVLGIATLALAAVPVLRPYLVNYANQLVDHLTLPQAFERLPGISLLAGALIFVAGVAATFIVIPTITFLQKETPDEIRGRTFGLLSTITAVLQGLVALAFGAAADIFTPPPLMAAVGGLALLIALLGGRLFDWFLAR